MLTYHGCSRHWRLSLCLVLVLVSPALAQDWRQWGDPNRSFHFFAANTIDTSPCGGPIVRWQRELGGGYAGMLSASSRNRRWSVGSKFLRYYESLAGFAVKAG